MKLCFTLLCGLVIFICHGDSNKQDYVHCINVGKTGRCARACAQVYMHVCTVVFFDRKMLSCGSVVKVYDWLD